MILDQDYRTNYGPYQEDWVEVVGGSEITGVMEMALEDYVKIEEAYGDLRVDQCMDEFAMYTQDGEIPLEEAGGAFVAKVKAFFQKMWNSIKAFWAKVVDKLKVWFLNTEKFYIQNRDKIAAGASHVQGFTGYKYGNIAEIANNVQAAAQAAKATIYKVDKESASKTKWSKRKEAVRGAMAGVRGTISGPINSTSGTKLKDTTLKSIKQDARTIAGNAKSVYGSREHIPSAARHGAAGGMVAGRAYDDTLGGGYGFKGDFESALAKLRTIISGRPEANNFKNNLINRYRGENKVTLSEKDFDFTDLATASNINKSVAIASKSCDAFMSDLMNQVDSMSKWAGEGNQGLLSRKVAYLKEAAKIFHTAMGVCASLMSASLNQTKAFAIAAVRAAGNIARGEAAYYDDDDVTNYSEGYGYNDFVAENGFEPITDNNYDIPQADAIYEDDEGYLVDENGYYVDENGYYLNPDGGIVY